MAKKKKVVIEAIIEVDDDFNVQDLAIGKYVFDSLSDTDFIMPSIGTTPENTLIGQEQEYFRVADYLEITEEEIHEDGEKKSND